MHCSKPQRLLANLYPTTRQRTLWDNVQQAKLRGLSLRAIARELGIHRNTVHKYALADVNADGEMTRIADGKLTHLLPVFSVAVADLESTHLAGLCAIQAA